MVFGEGKLTKEEKREIFESSADITVTELARKYNISRSSIFYHRYPEYKRKTLERNHKRRQFNRWASGVKRRRIGTKPRRKKRDVRLEEIKRAIRDGMGVDIIEKKIDDNLSKLTEDYFYLAERISECRKVQKALYRFLNPAKIIISDDDVVIEEDVDDKSIYMTSLEFKLNMKRTGLTARSLHVATNRRYSLRSIQAYMYGQMKVPLQLADFIRGYADREVVNG